MTTAVSVLQQPQEECTVGSRRMAVTRILVTADKYSWSLYRTPRDEWWEGCGNCDSDSGTKPWYGHVFNGVCFQCGGAGVSRIAGSEKAMITKIRRRVSSRKGTLNAIERREDALRAAAEEWSVRHPNLASDLAYVRANDTFDGNVLGRLALTAKERALSVRQEAYAISLLSERAWKEAHAKPSVERAWIGEIGERVIVAGTVSVWKILPNERWDRSASVLIVITSGNVEIKMVTGAAWAFDVSKGDSVAVSAKVRAHIESDSYGKQTEVSHPKKVPA